MKKNEEIANIETKIDDLKKQIEIYRDQIEKMSSEKDKVMAKFAREIVKKLNSFYCKIIDKETVFKTKFFTFTAEISELDFETILKNINSDDIEEIVTRSMWLHSLETNMAAISEFDYSLFDVFYFLEDNKERFLEYLNDGPIEKFPEYHEIRIRIDKLLSPIILRIKEICVKEGYDEEDFLDLVFATLCLEGN